MFAGGFAETVSNEADASSGGTDRVKDKVWRGAVSASLSWEGAEPPPPHSPLRAREARPPRDLSPWTEMRPRPARCAEGRWAAVFYSEERY